MKALLRAVCSQYLPMLVSSQLPVTPAPEDVIPLFPQGRRSCTHNEKQSIKSLKPQTPQRMLMTSWSEGKKHLGLWYQSSNIVEFHTWVMATLDPGKMASI